MEYPEIHKLAYFAGLLDGEGCVSSRSIQELVQTGSISSVLSDCYDAPSAYILVAASVRRGNQQTSSKGREQDVLLLDIERSEIG